MKKKKIRTKFIHKEDSDRAYYLQIEKVQPEIRYCGRTGKLLNNEQVFTENKKHLP
jgi:hypothetical protein